MQLNQLGTIFGVWAHPDDETFLSAGIMAAAAKNGQRVVCVTATKGEGGVSDDYPVTTITETRTAELAKALEILGVEEHFWLGYTDGSCSEVQAPEAALKVQAFLERVRPDSILTFGPDGWTGHPDHKAVSRWVTLAVRASASPARLYYAVMTEEQAVKFGPMKRPKAYHSQDAPSVASDAELALRFLPEGEIWELKSRAIEAHASQVKGITDAFGEEFLRQENQGEYFRLADPSLVR